MLLFQKKLTKPTFPCKRYKTFHPGRLLPAFPTLHGLCGQFSSAGPLRTNYPLGTGWWICHSAHPEIQWISQMWRPGRDTAFTSWIHLKNKIPTVFMLFYRNIKVTIYTYREREGGERFIKCSLPKWNYLIKGTYHMMFNVTWGLGALVHSCSPS